MPRKIAKSVETVISEPLQNIQDIKESDNDNSDVKILKKLFPSISQADEAIIIQIIEHLHSSGRIKITSWFKWLKASVL